MKQLTHEGMASFPHCSPDGWVVYASYGSGRVILWKVSIDGGDPVRLTDKLSSWPAVSPDGKLIACTYREESHSTFEIAVIPFEGGRAAKRFSVPPTVGLPDLIRWTADGRALTYIDTRNGISNIWGQPLDGGSPRRLTEFRSDQIFYFDWSKDGKWLACSRGVKTNDVVLINGFK